MAGPTDDEKRDRLPVIVLQQDPYEPDDDVDSIENYYEANADVSGPVDGDVEDHWAN